MGERQIDKETIEPEQVVADTYERNLVVNSNATTSYQQSSMMTTVSFTPMHLQLSVALLFSLCVSLPCRSILNAFFSLYQIILFFLNASFVSIHILMFLSDLVSVFVA